MEDFETKLPDIIQAVDPAFDAADKKLPAGAKGKGRIGYIAP